MPIPLNAPDQTEEEEFDAIMNDIDAVDLQVKNQKSEVMKEYQQK